jgi:hypothetical protein
LELFYNRQLIQQVFLLSEEGNFKEQLLTDLIHLRGVLIRQLVNLGFTNFKVLDNLLHYQLPDNREHSI